MQLTFNTSGERKELPVLLIGTLSVTIPLHQMQGIAQHATELNGGRIGYDTFCHRVNREYDVIMPAAKDSATVLIQPLGYGDPITDERGRVTTTTHVNFLVYEPVIEPLYDSLDEALSEQGRIKITLDNGTSHHYKFNAGIESIGWLVTAMEALAVEQCECIVNIKIGLNKCGLAHEWLRGSRRILYRNLATGDETFIAFPWNKSSTLYAAMDIEIDESYQHNDTDFYGFDRIKVNEDGMIIVWAGLLRFQKPIDKGWYRINPDGYTSALGIKFIKRLHKLVSDYAVERAGY